MSGTFPELREQEPALPGNFSLGAPKTLWPPPDSLAWVLTHAGLVHSLTRRLVAITGPSLPSSFLGTLSLSILTPTGYRRATTQDVGAPQDRAPDAGMLVKRYSTLALLHRHTLIAHPNQPSPYPGQVTARRQERDPSRSRHSSGPAHSHSLPGGSLILEQSAPLPSGSCAQRPQTQLTD